MNSRCLIKISAIITSLFLYTNNSYCMNQMQQIPVNKMQQMPEKHINKKPNKPKHNIIQNQNLTNFIDPEADTIEFQEDDFVFELDPVANETNENMDAQEIYMQPDTLNCDTNINNIVSKIDTLKQRFNNCDTSLNNIISKIDKLNPSCNNCDANFKNIISKLDLITKEITDIKKNIQTNKNYNNTTIIQPNNKLSTSVKTPVSQSANIFPKKQSSTTIVQNNNKLLTNVKTQVTPNTNTLPIKPKTNDLSYSSTQINTPQPMQQYSRNQSVNYGQTYNTQAPVQYQQKPNYQPTLQHSVPPPTYIPPSIIQPANIRPLSNNNYM